MCLITVKEIIYVKYGSTSLKHISTDVIYSFLPKILPPPKKKNALQLRTLGTKHLYGMDIFNYLNYGKNLFKIVNIGKQ